MSGHGDENSIGIPRINRELRDLLSIAQTEMRPGFSRVDRFVDTVTERKIGAMQTFAAADVDHVRIGNGNSERADRAGRLIVENRLPGAAAIIGFENATINLRGVEDIRLRRYTADRASSSAAKRADISPAQCASEIVIDLRLGA